MGFPRHLLLLLVLFLSFANCFKSFNFNFNLTQCAKPSKNQNQLENARTVVIILTRLTHIYGSHQFSYGNGTNAVHGRSWCGPSFSEQCSQCISEAGANILKECHSSVAGFSWFGDFCNIRYDTYNFTGKADTHLVHVEPSQEQIANVPQLRSVFQFAMHDFLNILQKHVRINLSHDYDDYVAAN